MENKFDHILSGISMDRWSKHYEISKEDNNGKEVIHCTPVRHGFAQRHIGTRAKAFIAAPVEILASLQNLIKLPFQILGAPLKYFCRKASSLNRWRCCSKDKNFRENG